MRKDLQLRPDNPLDAIPSLPFVRLVNRDLLSRDEVEAVLVASRSLPPDEEVVIALLLICGLSLTDIAALDVEDFVQEAHESRLKLRTRQPPQDVPIPPVVEESIARLAEYRTSGALIRNRADNRMNRGNITRLVRNAVAGAGIQRKVTTLVLIRSMARIAYEQGAPIPAIAHALGKKDTQGLLEVVKLAPLGSKPPSFYVADALAGRDGQAGMLAAAIDFLEDDGVPPAIPIVVAGVGLEMHLRKLCTTLGFTKAVRRTGIAAYADALKSAGNLTRHEWRQVMVWDDLRNSAAHGHHNELSRDVAVSMIEGVRKFIGSHPARDQ